MERMARRSFNNLRSTNMIPLALAMLLASLGTSIANVALPTLAEAWSAPFPKVQAVVVIYLAALTVSVAIAGKLGDRYGLKLMLIAGLATYAVASLLCAVAPTLPLLIGARALQGAGAAFLTTLSMALMRQTASEARIGRAMGLLATVSALGTALGPSVGGLLIPMTGWRGIFWIQTPPSVLALALAVKVLPADSGRIRASSVSLLSLMNWSLASNLLVNVAVAGVMMTTLVVGPFFLGIGPELTATQVGFVMAVGPVLSIFIGFPSGRMVDALGSRRVLTMGLALLAVGTFLLAGLPERFGVGGYTLSIMVLTSGYQLFQSANNTAVLAESASDQRGMMSGLLSLSRNIGLIIGASVMGAIFAFGVGTEEFAHAAASDIVSGMRLTFLIAAGAMLVAIAIMVERHTSAGRQP